MVKIVISFILVVGILFSPAIFSNEKLSIEQLIELRKNELSKFDGIWRGKISSANNFNDTPESVYSDEIIFEIIGEKISVYNKPEDEFLKYNYDYKYEKKGTNAIIFTLASSKGWTESFAFNITLEDSETMKVVWTRIVNNFVYDLDNVEARAYFHGISSFNKIGP